MSKLNFSVFLYESWEDNAKSHHVVIEAEDMESARKRAEEVCPGFKVRSINLLDHGYACLIPEAHKKWVNRGDTDYLILS